MDNTPLPEFLWWSPRPGQRVRWRKPVEAAGLGWLDEDGPGPFQVMYVIDRRWQGMPNGCIVKTKKCEREVNALYLAPLDDRAAALNN